MSGSDRTAIRAAARLALQSSLTGMTEISAWAQSVDANTLPAWAVATPRETRSRESHGLNAENLVLAVMVKRLGGDDIEDLLDADSAPVEAAVVGALRLGNMGCDLSQTEIKVDGEGAKRLGTLTMAFTVTYWVADPA